MESNWNIKTPCERWYRRNTSFWRYTNNLPDVSTMEFILSVWKYKQILTWLFYVGSTIWSWFSILYEEKYFYLICPPPLLDIRNGIRGYLTEVNKQIICDCIIALNAPVKIRLLILMWVFLRPRRTPK